MPVVKGVCPVFGDVTMSFNEVDVMSVQCTILATFAELNGDGPPFCLVASSDLNCDGVTSVTDIQICIQVALDLPMSEALDSDKNACPDACDKL